ncbi:MAG: tRNA lysidine(34) synthetase TilS [Paludibacteraceae bacterium]|nr:tRNA lysidine(34) synthetase TilS [Paludibacteraceae bacterium]
MLNRIKSYIESEKLIHENGTVVVGLSGGADSMVMLHVLRKLGYHCLAAHCNFHLRMEESDRDEDFVRKYCFSQNIDLYSIDFETVEYAKTNKISIEMAARELRYGWFEEIRKKTGSEAIVVAHHADDNAETMLLNLVRGTGIRGLTGIGPKNGLVIRPLLCVRRYEIENYALENKIEYITDSTNQENEYQRNKLRNQIIPLLSEINPSVVQTLNDNAVRLRNTFSVYEQFVEEKRNLIVEKKDEEYFIDIELLKNESEKETLMYEFCREFGFHSDQINSILQSLKGISGKKWYATDYIITKDRKQLIIKKIESTSDCEGQIDINTEVVFEPIKLSFRRFKRTADYQIERSFDCVHIDESLLKYPLKLRKVKTGDSFVPYGMKGRKKLSDFFIDLKLNAYQKAKTYVLVSDSEIVWVVWHRVDNRYAVTNKTTVILEVKICSE